MSSHLMRIVGIGCLIGMGLAFRFVETQPMMSRWRFQLLDRHINDRPKMLTDATKKLIATNIMAWLALIPTASQAIDNRGAFEMDMEYYLANIVGQFIER